MSAETADGDGEGDVPAARLRARLPAAGVSTPDARGALVR